MKISLWIILYPFLDAILLPKIQRNWGDGPTYLQTWWHGSPVQPYTMLHYIYNHALYHTSYANLPHITPYSTTRRTSHHISNTTTHQLQLQMIYFKNRQLHFFETNGTYKSKLAPSKWRAIYLQPSEDSLYKGRKNVIFY